MTITEKLRDMEEESKRNQIRVDEYLWKEDCTADDVDSIHCDGESVVGP